MTARVSLIVGKTRDHRPRLQVLLHEFCNFPGTTNRYKEFVSVDMGVGEIYGNSEIAMSVSMFRPARQQKL